MPKNKKTDDFRRFLDIQLPEGTAHMSDADGVRMQQLLELVGDPVAAKGLIAEIDGLLATLDGNLEAFNRAMGVQCDSVEEGKAFLRAFRALLTGSAKKSRKRKNA